MWKVTLKFLEENVEACPPELREGKTCWTIYKIFDVKEKTDPLNLKLEILPKAL